MTSLAPLMVAYLYYFYLWTIFLVQVSGFSLVLLVLLVLFFVLAGMEQRRVEDEVCIFSFLIDQKRVEFRILINFIFWGGTDSTQEWPHN